MIEWINAGAQTKRITRRQFTDISIINAGLGNDTYAERPGPGARCLDVHASRELGEQYIDQLDERLAREFEIHASHQSLGDGTPAMLNRRGVGQSSRYGLRKFGSMRQVRARVKVPFDQRGIDCYAHRSRLRRQASRHHIPLRLPALAQIIKQKQWSTRQKSKRFEARLIPVNNQTVKFIADLYMAGLAALESNRVGTAG